MEFQEYLNQPNLRPFIKKFRAEDYLFRQGQMGNTMFIVVEGKVELIAEADQGEHVEAILGPGHFLGEKAMLQDSPYQRLFGARAAEITKVLELSGKDVQEIQRTAP
jgi:CRP-like cAMP-binding protein